MADFELEERTLEPKGNLPEITVQVGGDRLYHDDDVFLVKGDEKMIYRLLQDPIALITEAVGPGFPGEGRDEVTVLFSYPDTPVAAAEETEVVYTVEGVKTTSLLTVRATRVQGGAPNPFRMFSVAETGPKNALHIAEVRNDGTVFAHFHLGENDQEMRNRVTAIALRPDDFIAFINDAAQVKQVRLVDGSDVEVSQEERKVFALPGEVGAASSVRSLRELRYLFQWLKPAPGTESGCDICNKLRGTVTPDGAVVIDTFITGYYCKP